MFLVIDKQKGGGGGSFIFLEGAAAASWTSGSDVHSDASLCLSVDVQRTS